MTRMPTHPNPVYALAATAALATVGVRLLYAQPVGIGLPLFLVGVAAGASATNRVRVHAGTVLMLLAALAVGLMPLVEDTGPLAILSGLSGLVIYTLGITGYLSQGRAAALDGLAHLGIGAFALPGELTTLARAVSPPKGLRWRGLVGWLIPLGLSLVFVALFQSANPLIDTALAAIPWSSLTPHPDVGAGLVWVLLATAVWPALAFHPRFARRPEAALPTIPLAGDVAAPIGVSRYLDGRTVVRCLTLFNLVFAVQSASDLAFLWGGATLPDGVTYASYAHRGAYPLMLTALLAALFILVAMRATGNGDRTWAIRRLVSLWIAQNIVLVISAMLRLDLYIATYSLTLLRVAALIWMGLVAVGLALILVQIALRRSNAWLVTANAAALGLTLYACTFVNFGGLVAAYNVDHSLSDTGFAKFDLDYAMSLGAAAIPALDRYAATLPVVPYAVCNWRRKLVEVQRGAAQDWRSWTYRGERLSEYLRAHEALETPCYLSLPGKRP